MPSMEELKAKGKTPKRANPNTIQDKFLVGYQGWFTCAGDGEPLSAGHHGWLHWFDAPIPSGGHPNTDLWPDMSEYSPSELFPAPGLKYKSGEQAFLFSSRSAKSVSRHFNWMAQHGVDGAFLQRFAHQLQDPNMLKIRDEVGENVRAAAEQQGRVFAIMYDVSSVPDSELLAVIQRDWVHLLREQGVLDSPAYLREGGKVVVAIWGFGFASSDHTPQTVQAITSFIRSSTPGGAYILAGTPAYWRIPSTHPPNTPFQDCAPGFTEVFIDHFDAISPWTVGRYRTESEADTFCQDRIKGDLELLGVINKHREEQNKRKVDYVPAVLPGGSGYNMTMGKWKYNDIKRNGGRFLWRQIVNVMKEGKRQGENENSAIRTVYGAMWDEYDEGTAMMPITEKKRQLPEDEAHKFPFMAVDEDGFDLPSDWYMRICGFAAEGIRGQRQVEEYFPSKDLLDYWSSRPVLEIKAAKIEQEQYSEEKKEKELKGPSEGQSYAEWVKMQEVADKDEPPPPAYSLEMDEEAVPSRSASLSSQAVASLNQNQAASSSGYESSAGSSYQSQSIAPAAGSGYESVLGPISQSPPPVATFNRPTNISTSPSSVPLPLQSPVIRASSAAPSVSASTRPPPVSEYTRPMSVSGTDSVSSLTNDFARQTSLATVPTQPLNVSPPATSHAYMTTAELQKLAASRKFKPNGSTNQPAAVNVGQGGSTVGVPGQSIVPQATVAPLRLHGKRLPSARPASVAHSNSINNTQTTQPGTQPQWPPAEWGVTQNSSAPNTRPSTAASVSGPQSFLDANTNTTGHVPPRANSALGQHDANSASVPLGYNNPTSSNMPYTNNPNPNEAYTGGVGRASSVQAAAASSYAPESNYTRPGSAPNAGGLGRASSMQASSYAPESNYNSHGAYTNTNANVLGQESSVPATSSYAPESNYGRPGPGAAPNPNEAGLGRASSVQATSSYAPQEPNYGNPSPAPAMGRASSYNPPSAAAQYPPQVSQAPFSAPYPAPAPYASFSHSNSAPAPYTQYGQPNQGQGQYTNASYYDNHTVNTHTNSVGMPSFPQAYSNSSLAQPPQMPHIPSAESSYSNNSYPGYIHPTVPTNANSGWSLPEPEVHGGPYFPRPPIHSSYSNSGSYGQQPVPGRTGGISLNRGTFAFVDKYVGKSTLDSLEGTVNDLTTSGSKLFGKFMPK